MTATLSADRKQRSTPTLIAQTLGTACDAIAATIFECGAASEAGMWRRGQLPDGAAREFDVGSDFRLRLYGASSDPSPESLGIAAIALEAWLANRALRTHAAQLLKQARATFEINRGICSLGGLDSLLLLVAERSRSLLHCELAGFALLDESVSAIVWRAMSGARTDTYRRVVFAPDGGVAGRAISTRRPVVVPDFLADSSLTAETNPISFAEGLRSVLAVPLDISHRARGCLMIGYREPHTFSADELDVLSSFASQAAIAVENAELYDRVRRERARVESVVESIDEGLVLIDRRARIAIVNRRTETIFDLPHGTFIGRTFAELSAAFGTRSEDPQNVHDRLGELVSSDLDVSSCDIELSGDPRCVLRFTSFSVYDGDRTLLGRGLLCRDITIERQIDSMKSDVIAIVSHEIRSPLASIRGCASALMDTERRRTKRLQTQYLETIDRESARLDDLVGNLTDVSLLDAGVLVLALHESDPTSLLERAIARKRDGIREIRFECEARSGFLCFDHRRIEQVVDNVLDNALKYSEPTSEIVVSARYTATEFVVAIRDHGVGIARPLQARVFERFYRIEDARHKAAGSGLGLYISRGIVLAHGGRIWLESEAGLGTLVSFALPRPGAPA